MATRLRIPFTECEHNGDMEHYAGDIRACGGTIIRTSVDPDAEEGYAIVEVDDKDAFIAKFKETESYDFVG